MSESAPADSGLRWGRWAFVAALLALFGAWYTFGVGDQLWDAMKSNLDIWKQQVEEHRVLAVLSFFAVYLLVVAFSLPITVPLSLLAGALFGRWLGTGIVSVAFTSGATLAFLGSRYLFRDWAQRRFRERLTAINRGMERDGAFYLFLLRLIPGVPIFVANVGMALTPMHVGTFAAVSWLGTLGLTFLYVNFGTQLSELESPTGLLSWPVAGSLVVLGVGPLLVRKSVQWWQARH